MPEDNFLSDLQDEMKTLQSNEGVGFSIDLILKEYKNLKKFIENLPKEMKPVNQDKIQLAEDFFLTGKGFVLGDTGITISGGVITISNKAGSWVYSKTTQIQNNKLFEQIASKIKELSEHYRTIQKQKIEEAHKKLIEDIENF